VAEPTDDAEQQADSLPDGNDDSPPCATNGSTGCSGHHTHRHREPTQHTSDGDRAGTGRGPTSRQDTTQDPTDATGDLPNRRSERPCSDSQSDTETTGERSYGACERSA
jgi:hypothetical protein